jgi:hypothetical protein
MLLAVGVTWGTFLSGGARAEPVQGPATQQAGQGTRQGDNSVPGGPPALSQIPYLNQLYRQAGAAGGGDRREPSGAYKVVIQTPQAAEPVLNELWAQGWELCSTSAVGSTPQVMFVFKRAGRVTATSGGPQGQQGQPHSAAEDRARAYSQNFEGRGQAGQTPGDDQSGFEVIRLRRVDAAEAADLLRGLLKSCEVRADAKANSVLLRGAAEDVALMKKLLQRLEAKAPAPGL